ncbi:MAG: hypothetical protein Q8S84_04240 [bacterium]|nr:hypothetical protein [bacterium]MDP3380714.1 hypothetical protein [bacterium]
MKEFIIFSSFLSNFVCFFTTNTKSYDLLVLLSLIPPPSGTPQEYFLQGAPFEKGRKLIEFLTKS